MTDVEWISDSVSSLDSSSDEYFWLLLGETFPNFFSNWFRINKFTWCIIFIFSSFKSSSIPRSDRSSYASLNVLQMMLSISLLVNWSIDVLIVDFVLTECFRRRLWCLGNWSTQFEGLNSLSFSSSVNTDNLLSSFQKLLSSKIRYWRERSWHWSSEPKKKFTCLWTIFGDCQRRTWLAYSDIQGGKLIAKYEHLAR